MYKSGDPAGHDHGDHKITAAAIAKRIGILHDLSEACEGADIENMSDEQLKEFVPNISVYARVSPERQDPYCPCMAGEGNDRGNDRRRCE